MRNKNLEKQYPHKEGFGQLIPEIDRGKADEANGTGSASIQDLGWWCMNFMLWCACKVVMGCGSDFGGGVTGRGWFAVSEPRANVWAEWRDNKDDWGYLWWTKILSGPLNMSHTNFRQKLETSNWGNNLHKSQPIKSTFQLYRYIVQDKSQKI